MINEDAVAIATYCSFNQSHSRFRDGNTTRQEANTILSQLQRRNIIGSGTGLYDAVLVAIVELMGRQDSERTVLLLSHGTHVQNPGVFLNRNILINLLNQNDITVHTIAVPNQWGNIPVVNYDRLEDIANRTGGAFLPIWNFNELFFEFYRSDIDMTDTDNDGIIDIHEKAIANEEILMGNNRPIRYAYRLSYLKYDSDGDGLLDGEEIEIRFTLRGTTPHAYIVAHSYPTMVDSDGDGIPDNLDPTPLARHDNRRFQFVNDINYRPINLEVAQAQVRSDLSHNTRDATSEDRGAQARAYATVGVFLSPLPNGAVMLNHFLLNVGDVFHIGVRGLLDNGNARRNFEENVDFFLEASEHMVMDGDTQIISTIYVGHPRQFIATNFGPLEALGDAFFTGGWAFGLGNSHAAMVGEVNRNGNSFTATLTYFVDDFYDWNEGSTAWGGFVLDGEMYNLHTAGLAKQYRVDGALRGIIINWEAGQRLQGRVGSARAEVILP